MNRALQGKYSAVRALLSKACGDEIATRYEIAQHILSVQAAPDRYGARGVDKLAFALRFDRATLYRYAMVGRAFDAQAIRSALRQQKHGHTNLTWSHLVVLSGVAESGERARLLEEALAGLSVRELGQRAHARAAATLANSAMAALTVFLSRTEGFSSRAMLDIDLSAASASDLDRLVRSQEQLRDICERNLAALRQAKAEAARNRAAVPGVRDGRPKLPRLLAG